MSVRSTFTGLARRLPFGIGTVTMVLVAALVAIVGVVLATGSPSGASSEYTDGRLRAYHDAPEVAWTQSSDTLPGYRDAAGIEVVDTWRDQWLLSYPSGMGRAYLLVDRSDGQPTWDAPVLAGLGSCAINEAGQVGCAIKLGDHPDGFYLIDGSGSTTSSTALDDTQRVAAVGMDFLRIDAAGYRATLQTTTGREIWSRTFASAAKVSSNTDDVLSIATADGTQFVVDPATGRDRLSCSQCSITAFGSGITVQYNEFGHERVASYPIDDGTVADRPVAVSEGLRVLDGPSTLPVLTGTGDGQVQAAQGRYQIRDPARAEALWQVTDPELSKANTKPCGTMVALALKDRSRLFYTLRDGQRIGRLDPPSFEDPDANIDQLSCVGSSGDTVVFANPNQITAFDARAGRIAWTRPVIGSAQSVDGYLVVREGTTLTVLRPN
ncbi:hypothetical protein AAFP35_02315 [Gordonia sp. CPCC 206044]|uniref:hypothetical protein n=1 Tax=Gordonia sp. CPCC 206044 TaxID=3140793 RepID=UPI003AF3C77A